MNLLMQRKFFEVIDLVASKVWANDDYNIRKRCIAHDIHDSCSKVLKKSTNDRAHFALTLNDDYFFTLWKFIRETKNDLDDKGLHNSLSDDLDSLDYYFTHKNAISWMECDRLRHNRLSIVILRAF